MNTPLAPRWLARISTKFIVWLIGLKTHGRVEVAISASIEFGIMQAEAGERLHIVLII